MTVTVDGWSATAASFFRFLLRRITPDREYVHIMASSLQRWHPERPREHATYALVKAVLPARQIGGTAVPCGIGIYRTAANILVSSKLLMDCN